MPYTEVEVTGYNASPPPDDGSTGATNQVSWAGIKTKLADPLNTAIASIDDNVASAVAAVEARLDTLEGYNVTSTLYAPSSTVMPFRQTSAPTGWTKDVTNYDNHALRVTTGTPSAFTGGLGVSTLWQASAYSTAATTLMTSQIPSHSHADGNLTATTNGDHKHTFNNNISGSANVQSGSGHTVESNNSATDTTSTDGDHSHTVTGSTSSAGGGGSHVHTVDLRLDYVDIIFATKD